MRFVHYINEGLGGGRLKLITEKEYTGFMSKECKKNASILNNNPVKIYRGTKSNVGEYGYINSNIGRPRMSANTKNYMTLLMDNLPSWKNYPKRSKGIICSTNKRQSYSYGLVYMVTPFDDAKIGVCSDFDVWDSFDVLGSNMGVKKFNDFLAIAFGDYGIDVDETSYDSLIDSIKELIDNDRFMNGFFQKRDFRNTVLNTSSKDLVRHLDKVLSPEKNGFSLGIEKIENHREVWIQGEAVMIKNELLKDL